MEGQDDNYATTSDIASLRTDMEQTQATLRHWLFDPATRRSKDSARSDTYTQQMELLFNRITDLTEGEKIQAYTEGLKMEIRRQVIAANYNSYRDIV
ncbi:unnamed protein product, partial [Closterium sp. NIES-53]